MPDITVRAGGQAATLHSVLRGGRHVLVVPADDPASALDDVGLRPYRKDFSVVTGDARETTGLRNNGTRHIVLVRPDGHVAARGRPGNMHAVTSYLRDLFGDPVGQSLCEHSAEGPLHAVRGTAVPNGDLEGAEAGQPRAGLSVRISA
jgi:hypothetical protein